MKFLTISPTHVPGKKEYAWNRFYEGGYIAIGWISGEDMNQKTLEQVISILRDQEYDNEANAIDAFDKFLTLEIGDYVAVNNTNDGLFGIGIVSSEYRYKHNGHDTGAEDEEEFYSHFRNVKWIHKDYVKREDIISPGETGWRPFGTVGSLLDSVPPYIQRLVGKELPQSSYDQQFVVPDFLKNLVLSIKELITDPKHQERAHESLVEDFFALLGFLKHRHIKYRQGRVDISLWEGNKLLAVVEVKRDWNLNIYNKPNAVLQAYKYALDKGSRYVILTNGDYYAIYDRLKGLSLSTNLIAEFRLSGLQDDDVATIQRIHRDNLLKPDLEEIFKHLSECF